MRFCEDNICPYGFYKLMINAETIGNWELGIGNGKVLSFLHTFCCSQIYLYTSPPPFYFP